MSVSGLIDVSIVFSDTTARETKTVAKSIALLEQSDELTGKIAVISGTVGVSLLTVTPTYRNAAGAVVTFPDRGDSRGGYDRIALQSQSAVGVRLVSGDEKMLSRSGMVAINAVSEQADSFSVQCANGGTADWLVLMYADS